MSTSTSIVNLARTKNSRELEKLAKKREKEIDRNYKQLTKYEDQLLNIKDSVATIDKRLREKREHEKSLRVSTMRVHTHKHSINLDATKRPADRNYEIRSYSKMDMDIWHYDQVRSFFNTYAKDEVPYRYTPSETGYTLKID
jgi:hypothetical protein